MRWNISLGVAVAVALALPATLARADGLGAEPVAVALRLPKVQATKAANFDWLAKRARVQTVAYTEAERAPTQIGKGSWICSPAGFGKKSRCYSN